MSFSPPRLAIWQKLSDLRRISRILWVRVALILALSILAALSAKFLDPFIPQGPKDRFGAASTLPILTILANTMLAVATFSLGVMVSSHRTMAEQTTPRIHRLLMDDTSTQSMLATFVGAFAFALSSIILFRGGYYSDSASVIVFGATVLVVLAIIFSLVRWIHQLSRIGSMDYALERTEDTARDALIELKRYPYFGGQCLTDDAALPSDAMPVPSRVSGYLRRIDMQRLQKAAEAAGGMIYITALPGDLVLSDEAIVHVTGSPDPEQIRAAIVVATNRSYEQDPRFAIQAMRETASKALSPGVNDPGTAVEVVARLQRLLWDGLQTKPVQNRPVYDRVFLKSVPDSVLIASAFQDITRDGAAFVDVLEAINAALTAMANRCDNTGSDQIEALRDALRQHADVGLKTQAERDRLGVSDS